MVFMNLTLNYSFIAFNLIVIQQEYIFSKAYECPLTQYVISKIDTQIWFKDLNRIVLGFLKISPTKIENVFGSLQSTQKLAGYSTKLPCTSYGKSVKK